MKPAPQNKRKAGRKRAPSRTVSRPPKAPTRTASGTFAPGSSGNPGGRPLSFGALIRQSTNDGAELVSLALAVMRGEKLEGERRRPSVSLRLEAADWLANRGWGRPRASVDVELRPFDERRGAELAEHLEKYASVLADVAGGFASPGAEVEP